MKLIPNYSHYHIDESGKITVAITRARSPIGKVIKPQIWRGMQRVYVTDGSGKRKPHYVHELV